MRSQRLLHFYNFNLPPTVENWPKESSEATFIPFSSVVTWVTWSCLLCHSVPLTISGGGAGMFGRGWFRGGMVPLLRGLFCTACLEVLWKARIDLPPRNIGTTLRPAIFTCSYRGHWLFQRSTKGEENCLYLRPKKIYPVPPGAYFFGES